PGMLTHDRLFVSSMPGSDPMTGKVPGDPAAQVDLALDRVEAVLKAAGLGLGNMVFVNPYMTTDLPARVMNEHYARRFEFGNTPARATIEVASLPDHAHIEYTGVAVRDLAQRKAVRPKNMPPSPTASPCLFAGDTLYCSAKDGFIPGPHGGVNAAVRPRNEPILGRTIQYVSCKYTGAGRRTGGHVFRTHRFSLRQIPHRHACVLDVGAAGKARHFDRGSRRSVPELKAPGVMLIHDPRGKVGGQIGIHENHVAQPESGCPEDGFYAVERQIHLGSGVVRDFSGGRIAARHTGNKKPVVGQHSRRSRVRGLVIWRKHRLLAGHAAHR